MLKNINLSNSLKSLARHFATKPKKDVSNAAYCAGSVKNFDYENFLCTLLIKQEEARRDAFAFRAFNVELARIPLVASDNKIALMRLKFWEDAISKIFDKNKKLPIPKHPVAAELTLAVERSKLSKRYFDRLITARRIPNINFISMKAMEHYAEETTSSINYLILEALNCRNVHADHAVSHLGKSQGISNLLRSIYLQKSNQHLPIPQELLIKHGISQERFFRSKADDKAVEDVVFDVATHAHQHYEKAMALKGKVPKEAHITFLPAVSTQRYLEKLRKVNFNLTDKSLAKRDNLLPLVLFWTRLRGI